MQWSVVRRAVGAAFFFFFLVCVVYLLPVCVMIFHFNSGTRALPERLSPVWLLHSGGNVENVDYL